MNNQDNKGNKEADIVPAASKDIVPVSSVDIVPAASKETKKSEQYIVGIGASAGGLEALQNLLATLPTKLGFPYIVIQHLSPDYKSLLSEILSKHTEMPVVQAEENTEILPDTVYVIPPRKSLTLKDGRLCLTEQISGGLHLPIDTFFNSLAEEAGPLAIAVVLSGTGSDGTNGIKSVKEHDGMVIVQSPDSSKFDGMPKSAMRTGLVDFIGSPREIASEIENVADSLSNTEIHPDKHKELDFALMERIYNILRRTSNVNFTHYKKATIMRRVERRMLLARKNSLAEYTKYLISSPEEAKILSKEVLIGVTNFFREPEYFELLQEKAIKPLLLRTDEETEIRVWIAGCSTGEEAYSIAILFCEAMESLKLKRKLKIFATDLDTEAITTAGKGVYGNSIAASVSATRLSKYFTRKSNSYTINRDVRKMLVFSPHNVVQDPPFARLDLVSCRNLLIYFEPILQKDLFSIFHAALKEGGYLFLGKSEAVGGYTEVFPVVDAAAKIFSHRSHIKIKGAKPVPYLQTFVDDYTDDDSHGSSFVNHNDDEYDYMWGNGGSFKERYMPSCVVVNEKVDEVRAINTALLERFMPACVVVNEKNNLVYVYGDCKDFITFPAGRASHAFFNIIVEQLRIPVSTALKEAREGNKLVQYTNVKFKKGDRKCVINLTATPISKQNTDRAPLFALIFAEVSDQNALPDALPYDIDHMAAQRITDLEQELVKLHDKLNRSVTEQEIVNEELQASNEELLTANEELQSSNEELQSVNEELYTVNSEYQSKLSELAEMNDDITNFLATTLIGIIFVDSKLCLRRFTNYVTTEFNIMDQDIGRPIEFIAYQFQNLAIAAVCNKVIDALVPDEREVDTNRGKTFFMRVVPFRTTENKILGCVITLVDLTSQKQEREKLSEAEAKLTIAQRNSAAKSDFLSRMSHEIRTPMNALVGLAEIIQSQLDDKEALAASAKQISNTAQYMASIVADVVEVSRMERSLVKLSCVPFSLRSTLEQVRNIFLPRMHQGGIAFSFNVADNIAPSYIGDGLRIQQLLLCFLSNAVKFTPKGGKVRFEAAEIQAQNSVATIQFIISDTGSGISKKFLPDLFKPFTRETKDDGFSSSMGLGLSISHGLVELMDGDIHVESEVGKGSTFTVRIKLVETNSSLYKDELPSPTTDIDFTGCKVLLAEDDMANRTVLEALLASKKINFVSVKEGKSATKAFLNSEEDEFDCILMDLRMPELDGVSATSLIRESGRKDSKTIPIVAITADVSKTERDLAFELGISYYITKPIDTSILFRQLGKYWLDKKARKQIKQNKTDE